jgi:hypothetical protein
VEVRVCRHVSGYVPAAGRSSGGILAAAGGDGEVQPGRDQQVGWLAGWVNRGSGFRLALLRRLRVRSAHFCELQPALFTVAVPAYQDNYIAGAYRSREKSGAAGALDLVSHDHLPEMNRLANIAKSTELPAAGSGHSCRGADLLADCLAA